MTPVRDRGFLRRRSVAVTGVAFAYFSLIGLPVLFFGAGLATDFTRIIVAARQVSNATQASALAGAQQFAPDRAELDPSAAIAEATDTYCYAQRAGVMTLSAPATGTVTCPGAAGGRVSLTVTPVETGTGVHTRVDVTARYTVTGLTFARLFGQGRTFEADPITRSAAVCVPGVKGTPTAGFCARPNGRP